jgi:hypothetical protein
MPLSMPSSASRRRSRGLLVVLVAALAVVVAGAVAALFGGDPDGGRAVGRVTFVGDSLNVGVEPYVPGELPGWTIVNADVVGRPTYEGVAAARSLGGDLGDVVVVSLGTNDPQADVAGFRRQVRELLRIAGPGRCVIWSTIWRDGPNDAFNAVLAGERRRHANVELLEWAALVGERTELLAFDGVHATPDGYARRAEDLAAIARRCLPSPPPEENAAP